MIGRWNKPPEEEREEPKGFDAFELRLGDIMRGERATMGKSLLDVQRELKIKATYIAAIENTDPSAFETQGFIAGYVRSYARYLGLDSEWAYERFCIEGAFSTAHGMSPAASGSRAPRPKPAERAPARDPFADPNALFVPRGEALFARIEPGALGSVAVLLALIIGIGYGGWSVFQEIQKVEFAPIDQAPGVVAELGDYTTGPDFAADTDLALVTPSADALERLYRPQALDVPVLVARDGPIAAIDPYEGRQLAEAAPSPAAPARPAPLGAADDVPLQVVEPEVPEVVLMAVRPSWVRVSAADGTVLFEKILDAGERYTLPQTELPPRLRSGNAGSVYFAVNGETFGPAGVGASVVSNIALAPDAIRESFVLADLSKDSDLADMINVAQAPEELIAQ